MRKLAFIASSLFVAVAIFACRGSVDREYFDDQQEITGAEAGHDADASQVTTGDAADAGQGDGATTSKDKDAGSDSGPPPKTAPANVTVTVNNGLFGTGLVLQDNAGDDMAIPSPGSYTFPTTIPPGKPYDVTVLSQPIGPSQTCTVLNGSGTAAGEDVTNVVVNCATATYKVGGSVIGLNAGQSVTLTNNGANDVTVAANSAFTFPAVASGAPFNVVTKSSTPGTTCTVSGGVGTVGTADVDSVVVNCGTNTYTVGGNVSGLTGTLVVQNNGGNDRTITTNGQFAFSTPIASGSTYAVTVKSSPNYPPQAQTCTVTAGTGSGSVGAGNVTSVDIKCTTNKYTVGGTISGLTGSGLKIQNKGTDDKSISAGGTQFTFATAIPSGSTYNVTVVTQPAGQTCSVKSSSGTIGKANVTNVGIFCAVQNPLKEDFQSATPPALPTGWTSVALYNPGSQNKNKWVTILDGDGTSKYANFPDTDFERDVALVSPVFFVTSATAKLSFTHYMDAEPQWDGGVLEISIAGGDWRDILDAGGSFEQDGYNIDALLEDGSSELGGRPAWNGYDLDLSTIVDLPASCAGQNVQLRWRFGADDGSGADGWFVDDVLVKN